MRDVVFLSLTLDGVMQSPARPDEPARGDVAESVARLRAEPGKDLVILGSGNLIRSLMPHNLIDRYILQIAPLVLASLDPHWPDR